MSKIFCLMGKSASGKDTLAKAINKEIGIPIAVSCTTRPMRVGEVQHREYHFLTEEEFHQKEFVEKREYHVYNGDTWYYGYSKDEFEGEDCVAIVDVEGYETLRDYFGKENVVAIYIHASEETLRKRLIKRGDNPKEIERRLEDDDIRFNNFIDEVIFGGEHYFVNNNYDLINSIEELAYIITTLEK